MKFNARIRVTRVVDDAELAGQILPKMQNLGQAIGARAQRLVPKRTWALHDTISAETTVSGSKVTTTVGAGNREIDYAMHVERGTSRMAAQPYLRPAMLQMTARDFGGGGNGLRRHGVSGTSRSRRRDRGAS